MVFTEVDSCLQLNQLKKIVRFTNQTLSKIIVLELQNNQKYLLLGEKRKVQVNLNQIFQNLQIMTILKEKILKFLEERLRQKSSHKVPFGYRSARFAMVQEVRRITLKFVLNFTLSLYLMFRSFNHLMMIQHEGLSLQLTNVTREM